MPLTGRVPRSMIAVVVAAAALTACSDNVVYRDREPFNPPPAGAGSFLGYYNAATKKTTCGNCHVDFQAQWNTTAHATAFATLNANVGKKPECYTCHTVTGKGNATTAIVAGHDVVKDPVYYDVQCESCHGPGLAHVEGVGQANLIRPLAKLSHDRQRQLQRLPFGSAPPVRSRVGRVAARDGQRVARRERIVRRLPRGARGARPVGHRCELRREGRGDQLSARGGVRGMPRSARLA